MHVTGSKLLLLAALTPGLAACGDTGEPPPEPEPLSVTPLVFQLAGDLVELEPAPADGADAPFEIEPGVACAHDWPTARSPWLVLDLDGNGRIDDGSELFGSGTELRTGELADHGFEALAELDANADGILDRDDPAFDALQLWWDHDADRGSDPRELSSLAAMGVEAISLDYWVDELCDDRGNCGRERAMMVYTPRDGLTRTGQVVDVHLACQG